MSVNIKEEILKYNFSRFGLSVSPSWGVIYITCPGEFEYGKVIRPKTIEKHSFEEAIDGRFYHNIISGDQK